jgi:hypothetical protein
MIAPPLFLSALLYFPSSQHGMQAIGCGGCNGDGCVIMGVTAVLAVTAVAVMSCQRAVLSMTATPPLKKTMLGNDLLLIFENKLP